MISLAAYLNAFFELHKDYNSYSQKTQATNFKQLTMLFSKEKKIQNVQVEVKCVKKSVFVIKRCQYLFETSIEKHNCWISQQFSIWKEKQQ